MMKKINYLMAMALSLTAMQASAAKYYFTQPMFIPAITRFAITSGAAEVSGFDYGSANVGTTSTAKSVTVTYNGVESITLPANVVSTPTNWTIQSNTCAGATLGPAKTTCTFNVAFTPKSAGALSESVSLNLPGFTTKPIALTGTGVSPIVSLNDHGSIITSPFATLRGGAGSIYNPFDGNDNTVWTAFYVAGEYIGRQFAKPVTVTAVRAYANTPVNWQIKANTPTGWVTLGSRSGTGAITLTGLNVTATAIVVTNNYPWNDVWFSVGTLDIQGIQ